MVVKSRKRGLGEEYGRPADRDHEERGEEEGAGVCVCVLFLASGLAWFVLLEWLPPGCFVAFNHLLHVS